MAHCGVKPSATQQAMIELCCQLKARLAAMDAAFVDSGAMTPHDAKIYLAWGNTLARTLSRLGAQAVASRPPSLAEYLAAKAENAA